MTFSLDRVACWLLERHVQAPDKVLVPSFIRSLTLPQLDLLIDVSMAADGSTDRNGVSRLGQGNEARIRAWEMVLALAGRPFVTRQYERRPVPKQYGPMWLTTTLRTSWSHAFGSALRKDRNHCQVEVQQYDGAVWCPTTPNGTWFARRNGTAYFTGNSRQPPYPYFGPALDQTGPEFVAALGEIVD